MTYSKQEVFNNIKSIIIELHPEIDAKTITDRANFSWPLKCDSYDKLEIIMHIELKYHMDLNNSRQYTNTDNIGELCNKFLYTLTQKAQRQKNIARARKQILFRRNIQRFLYPRQK